jgi:hypothetical protein
MVGWKTRHHMHEHQEAREKDQMPCLLNFRNMDWARRHRMVEWNNQKPSGQQEVVLKTRRYLTNKMFG